MSSSLEPLANGEVDEEVDTAVDGEAQVGDSKAPAANIDDQQSFTKIMKPYFDNGYGRAS